MTALNDAERAAIRRDAEGGTNRALPDAGGAHRRWRKPAGPRTWLPSRRFIAAVIAIGGMQLLATMDSTVAIVALPKIQDELSLSDAGRSWVITAYVLTFGGLMLLGGRLGDTIGRKRTFIVGVALFTIASILCGVAWDEATLVIARLLQGVGAAIASPTGLALIATTFPKGPARNAATAVFAAMTGVGSVMGLIVGGALTEVSWRLAFLVNVPDRAADDLPGPHDAARDPPRADEARRHRRHPGDAGLHRGGVRVLPGPGAGLAVAAHHRLGSWRRGVLHRLRLSSSAPRRTPSCRSTCSSDRNRVATFAAVFLAGGVMFTLTVLIGLYVQDIMGYSALHAGIGFIPFVIALGVGLGVSSHLVSMFPPAGAGDRRRRAGARRHAVRLHAATRGIPYFPNLVLPITSAASASA